jgi:transcriptional regulator with GAF, ATPase, and Fis domain
MAPIPKMTGVWVHSFCPNSILSVDTVIAHLHQAAIPTIPLNPDELGGPGIIILSDISAELGNAVRALSRNGTEHVLVLVACDAAFTNQDTWSIFEAGASDVLFWNELLDPSAVIAARFQRWREVDEIIESPLVKGNLVGQSQTWKAILRQIVEVARFTDAPVLLMGETGTGKELAARLIHALDRQRTKFELAILDCTTIVPELSGSEFFGHERGSYTGAVSARDGAFALANQGTLFLDEVGELPLGLQVQLLRVLQEHTYRRVGSNSWRQVDFRLVCATNRDLSLEEERGQFRRDLYYRIANWTFKLPPLRERTEDILPLVRHFIRQARSEGEPLELDERIQEYFLTRDYPGNVRDLRNLVFRVVSRHVGPGPLTIGDIPTGERPVVASSPEQWCDCALEQVVRRALTLGIELKGLRSAVEETAIRIAVDDEHGSLQRAARKLGVTDRALQVRRAEQRHRIRDMLEVAHFN